MTFRRLFLAGVLAGSAAAFGLAASGVAQAQGALFTVKIIGLND